MSTIVFIYFFESRSVVRYINRSDLYSFFLTNLQRGDYVSAYWAHNLLQRNFNYLEFEEYPLWFDFLRTIHCFH